VGGVVDVPVAGETAPRSESDCCGGSDLLAVISLALAAAFTSGTICLVLRRR
jgi:hypothetical protein